MLITIILLLLTAGCGLYFTSFRIGSGCWVKALCRAGNTGRQVALTFDDGHHAELTPQVLDVLKRYDAQACFFLVGERIDPGLLRRMDAEGHIVGNHTFSHKGTGPFAPVRSMVADARRTDDAIAGTLHRRPKLFRPPFGITNPMIGGMVRRMGYTVIGWSIRSLDTLAGPRGKVVERIRRQLHDGAVILLHDNRTGSPQLTELVLRMLAQEGYEVVRVDKLLNIHAYDNEN
ncbi:polysaccharide deacetylase family protein [Alistipes provencensis]|uniref:polysaccharide deacetylase family protein n=1 Tax=Alistipes provencensis TaxID=1816676 RepID=UPI0007EDE220|nr:polysaccharide deacetylase family protein [Alistipes provencensis]